MKYALKLSPFQVPVYWMNYLKCLSRQVVSLFIYFYSGLSQMCLKFH